MQQGVVTEFDASIDETKGPDTKISAEADILGNHSSGMDPGRGFGRDVEQIDRPGKSEVRIGGSQRRDFQRWSSIGNNDCGSAGRSKPRLILRIGEKGQVTRSSFFKTCDPMNVDGAIPNELTAESVSNGLKFHCRWSKSFVTAQGCYIKGLVVSRSASSFELDA